MNTGKHQICVEAAEANSCKIFSTSINHERFLLTLLSFVAKPLNSLLNSSTSELNRLRAAVYQQSMFMKLSVFIEINQSNNCPSETSCKQNLEILG